MYRTTDQPAHHENTWQRGNQVITYGIPHLPPFCVKCNRRCDYEAQRFSLQPLGNDIVTSAVAGAVSVVITLFVSFFTAILFSFTVFLMPNNVDGGMTILIPVCPIHRAIMKIPKIIGVPLILAGYLVGAMFVMDILYAFDPNQRKYLFEPLYWFVFCSLLGGGTLLYKMGTQSVEIIEEGGYYYIKGTGAGFRNRFPQG